MRHLVWMLVILPAFVLSSELSLAVLDFEPRGINSDQAVIITDMLRTELLKTGKITIVEREKINAIMKEHQYSEVGVTESVELGKILGVDKIIFGRIGVLGDSYIITVRMIDVETAKVDFADQYSCQMTMDSISKVMKEISEHVLKYLPPIEGKIALRDGNVVYITLTSKDGIKKGMELPVFRIEKRLDKEGNVIFEDEREIGEIKILKISSKGSMAKVVEEKEEIKEGDIVKVVIRSQKAEYKKPKALQNSVASSEKILPYWIEHDENGKPINYLWVKVPKIPAKSSKVIYIEKELGYSPDGDKVFEFFDDFDDPLLPGWHVDDYDYDGDNVVDYSVHDSLIEINKNGEAGYIYHNIGFEINTDSQYSIEYRGKTGKTSGEGECILGLTDGKPSKFSNNNGYSIHPFNTGNKPDKWSFRVLYEYNGSFYGTWNILKNLPYNTWCNFKFVINKKNLYTYEYCDNGLIQENSIVIEDSHYPHADKIWIRACCQDRTRYAVYDYIFIRKYADSEPIVTVQNKGSYYEVTITNPNSYDLTDFQVAIPISKLNITSATESLKICEGDSWKTSR